MVAVEREECRELHPAVAQFFVAVAVKTDKCVSYFSPTSDPDETYPQVSTPNMGMPKSAKFSAWLIEKYMYADQNY